MLVKVAVVFCSLGCSESHTPAFAAALANCQFETTGTSQPATSGTPKVVDETTGTVISANFFNSGAIDPQDGSEFVSVCVFPPDENGKISGRITSDIGLTDNTIIKAYPEIIIGTKFGNIYETSYRYYAKELLPMDQKWPVVATGFSASGSNYEFANLEYVSVQKNVGLPAFTNDLPSIHVTLNMDESNIIGSERDVMLESWFHDTSKNAAKIGNNAVTGLPIASTLNNIVGIGHPHYAELDNTLLEMMVHIGPLSKNDISNASRNPGQNQLTEIFSGKDYDGDGIDDHFDVDSHINVNTNLEPNPGMFSSGIDSNGDGVDDADILPIQIGNFLYSIWYGESFLAPIVIYSRESNDSLTNDFNPLIADMDLTEEGDINLDWNEFLDFTLDESMLQSMLQQAGVDWASGITSPFDAMRSNGGAISGIEFGIEPQINIPQDQPYEAAINTYDVQIDGRSFGLSDGFAPAIEITAPSNSATLSPGFFDISGTAFDSASGVESVGVRVQRLLVNPVVYWNGNTWVDVETWLDASLTGDNTNWSLAGVGLQTSGDYRISVNGIDKAGNVASALDNQEIDFSVLPADTSAPTIDLISPTQNQTLTSPVTIEGSAYDDVSIDRVELALTNSANLYYNGLSFQAEYIRFMTGGLDNWNVSLVLPEDSYKVTPVVFDSANNIGFSAPTSFTVGSEDSVEPVVTIITPSESQYLTSPVVIAGTASDDISVDRVELAMTNAAGQFFDGSTFQPNYIRFTTNGTENWSISLNLPNDSYTVTPVVFDGSNNYGFIAPVSFTVGNLDTASPSVVITSPTAGQNLTAPVTISGTASDDVSVNRVELAMTNAAGQFFDGSSFQPNYIRFTANGTEDWSISLNLPNDSYTVTPVVFDVSNNYGYIAPVSFTVGNQDTASPTVVITSPTAGQNLTAPVTISGTASDDTALDRVELALTNEAGQYYDGQNFQSSYVRFPAAGTQQWDVPASLPDGSYTVTAVVFDSSNNYGFTAPVFFTVGGSSNTIPSVTLISPSVNQSLTSPVAISGTAMDDLFVHRVELAITNSAGQYYNGTTFQADYMRIVASGTEQWNVSLNLPPGSYTVTPVVFDNSNNYGYIAPTNFNVN